MIRRIAPLVALLLLAAAPADFALNLPLQLVPDAPFQRIDLPASALAALQSADLADVRVFDSQGNSLPIARAGAAPQALVTLDTPLKPLPIMGTPGALNVTGVSLRMDPGQTRVVQVDGDVKPGAVTVLGVMFDTRQIADPAQKLLLDADLPRQQPVTFRVESSPDLRAWRPVADAVIYRDASAETAIDMAGAALKDQYLRLTWRTPTPPLSPIIIHGATLRSGRPAAAAAGPSIAIAARRDTAHRLSLALPFATPVTSLAIEPVGDNELVPVRILGRNDREQPWTLLGAGTAYRLTRDGKTEFGPPIPISGSARFVQIEGDERTTGFAAAPQIRLGFAPVSIVVLAQGAAPHRLTAGKAGATSALLPITALIPGYKSGAEYALPAARVTAPAGPAIAAAAADPRFGGRQLLLWAVLIGATLVLGGLVWALRRGKP